MTDTAWLSSNDQFEVSAKFCSAAQTIVFQKLAGAAADFSKYVEREALRRLCVWCPSACESSCDPRKGFDLARPLPLGLSVAFAPPLQMPCG